MWDESGVGKPMKSWLCVQLGTWHPYKQANTVIWSHWGSRIFGPLFNELIPNANFNKKARLATIVKFLTIVRMAFPEFRRDLIVAVNSTSGGRDRLAHSHLYDLLKLLLFFIPVVCFHHQRLLLTIHVSSLTPININININGFQWFDGHRVNRFKITGVP